MSHQEDATPASVPTADVMYKGVRLTDNGTYRVHLSDGGTEVRLGTYASAEEAARVYDREAKRRLGKKAVLNFHPDGSLNPFRFTSRRSGKKTSDYTGVHYDTSKKKYRARLSHGGRPVSIGWFKSDKEAALAYDKFVKQNVLSRPLNFLPDGSLNPHRHDDVMCVRHKRVRHDAEAPQVQRDSGASAEDTDQEEEEGQERGEEEEEEEGGGEDETEEEDTEEEEEEEEDTEGEEEEEQEEEDEEEDEDDEGEDGEEEEGEQEQQAEREEAGGRRKRRRLNDDAIIDLTDEVPSDLTASSPSTSANQPSTHVSLRTADSAASNVSRATAAVGGGGPDGPIQPLLLPAQPMPTPASPTRVQVEAASAVPLPASLPPIAKVEAPATQPRVQGGLKMTLLQAVDLLGQETFRRLAASQEGSEEMHSLERLVELLLQLRREAGSASSSSASSSRSSTAELQTFLLGSVCPRYTAQELQTNQSQLDNVLQMGICYVKL